MTAALLTAVSGCWLLATVLVALPARADPLKARIPAWLNPVVPSWTFFAPRPAVNDTILLYRDVSVRGDVGPLREVWPRTRPCGRAGKAVDDAVSHLLQSIGESEPGEPAAELERAHTAQVMLSVPYLMLLNRCAGAVHDPTADRLQFAIARASRRAEQPEVLFLSATHRLPSSDEGRGATW
ncbi:hypothetical protein [Streptomyces melanogenes]|uniref:hypothetical protein n=1 Tax=Streptomyces melanogenes TaxID=67326 RepID=UPI00378BF017